MRRYVRIFFANVLITLAYAFVTVPRGVINGGVTSLAMSLSRLLPVPVPALVTALLVLLSVGCYFFLGAETLRGSLVSCAFYLVLFNLLSLIPFAVPGPDWLVLPLAAAAVGAGYFLCVSSGATTVGVDTIALILHTRFLKLPFSAALYGLNIMVLLLGLATYGLRSVVSGVAFAGIQTLTIQLLTRFTKTRGEATGPDARP